MTTPVALEEESDGLSPVHHGRTALAPVDNGVSPVTLASPESENLLAWCEPVVVVVVAAAADAHGDDVANGNPTGVAASVAVAASATSRRVVGCNVCTSSSFFTGGGVGGLVCVSPSRCGGGGGTCGNSRAARCAFSNVSMRAC